MSLIIDVMNLQEMLLIVLDKIVMKVISTELIRGMIYIIR